MVVGLYIGTFASLRYFRDDHGLSLLDRKLVAVRPRWRTTVSLLAFIRLMNLVFIGANAIGFVMGPYASQYPKLPADLVNGMCDLPGTTGTAYGPCPGSPYRAPIRKLEAP